MGAIDYAGDPLKDFGLAPFLDKFAYRNPKSRDKVAGHFKRGESIAERRSGTDSLMRARLELPMNDPAFLERENVSEQDEFFHRYFVERARRDEIKGITRGNKTVELDEDELEEAEEGALDAAEEAEGLDTGKSFEEYERAWESDPEEEAFVDSLALKLLEDSADGPADFDDEDPDMDDWGDLDSDEGGHDGELLKVDSEEDDDTEDEDDSSEDVGGEKKMKDEDDFMDEDDSDSESGGAAEGPDDDSVPDEDSIEAGIDMADERGLHAFDSHSEEEATDLAFAEDSDGDDHDHDDELVDDDHRTGKKPKKADALPTFADAEEYEERINKDFEDLMQASRGK
eukprot:CAMPEP_0176031978 /NCGR_PEP_ID=MMETSP0120_2-20121206/15776_1 /TAXON_ID=160619 /ORGANISM="Kryptoperidinium foliaceum, Strain CCMP 1326" /LENGTH=341 /DNA_ID=CAMNT_0017365285 /DNA_START=1 /DNA_END=1023 /DNA_ORIENTATION=+